MTTSELLLQDFDIEMSMTRKLLARLHDSHDRLDFKPHPKSMALGKLAMHIATLPSMGSKIVTTPSLNLADPSNQWPDMTFRSCDQMLATFDTGVLEVRTALAAASDSTLAERWKFSFGDRVISDESRSLTFRHMFVNHLIHHRAQLGVYLRLNDLPVPAVYGPSADEPF